MLLIDSKCPRCGYVIEEIFSIPFKAFGYEEDGIITFAYCLNEDCNTLITIETCNTPIPELLRHKDTKGFDYEKPPSEEDIFNTDQVLIPSLFSLSILEGSGRMKENKTIRELFELVINHCDENKLRVIDLKLSPLQSKAIIEVIQFNGKYKTLKIKF